MGSTREALLTISRCRQLSDGTRGPLWGSLPPIVPKPEPCLMFRALFLERHEMTKADKIRALAKKHPEWSTAKLGDACGCRDSYVRTALRQRVNGKRSKHDLAYLASPLGQTWWANYTRRKREAANA